MAIEETFSRLTELETQLLQAIEILLPKSSGLTADDNTVISAVFRKANGLRHTPKRKPFTLERGQPVIYEGKGWTYTIKDGRHCLYKHHEYSNTDIHVFDVDWEKLLTWKEDDVRRYKAYLKEHGIKKRVTLETTYFDYTLHLKPKQNKHKRK